MKLLLIILTVMTWVVETKNSVSGEGQWPYSIEVDYACSYQKGQVTEGNTAVLSLGSLGGMTVQTVEVYVKSNKSSGAGTFTVQANQQTVATLSGSFKDWTGSYDNSNYHSICLLNTPYRAVNDLVISLVGTESSLFIEKYVITYQTPMAHTVTLMNGSSVYATMSETQGGAGVHLPILQDLPDWHFIGWSETEFTDCSTMPDLVDMTYYPLVNVTLWAVYVYKDPNAEQPVTDLETGTYIYTNRESKIALSGVPEGGRMAYSVFDGLNENQYYTIRFAGTDTAYITHTLTNTPIGYSGTQMAAVASPWLVYHDGEQTLFYAMISGQSYVLWLNIPESHGMNYAGLFQADAGPSPMALLRPSGTEEPLFTCHPEAQAIDLPKEDMEERVLGIGIYELHIVNGHKYLRLRQ